LNHKATTATYIGTPIPTGSGNGIEPPVHQSALTNTVLDYGGTGIDLNRLFKNLTRDIINSASALVDSPSAKELGELSAASTLA